MDNNTKLHSIITMLLVMCISILTTNTIYAQNYDYGTPVSVKQLPQLDYNVEDYQNDLPLKKIIHKTTIIKATIHIATNLRGIITTHKTIYITKILLVKIFTAKTIMYIKIIILLAIIKLIALNPILAITKTKTIITAHLVIQLQAILKIAHTLNIITAMVTNISNHNTPQNIQINTRMTILY